MIQRYMKQMMTLIVLFWMSTSFAQSYKTVIPAHGDKVTISDWLVTDPIDNHSKVQGIDQLDKEGYHKDFLIALGGETNPKIVASKKFEMPNGTYNMFNFHSWKEDYLDLTELFGNPTDVSAYLYAELESEKDQEVYLHIGTNDAGKVWLNDELVIEYVTKTGRSAEPSQNIAKIQLNKGVNTLLLKIGQIGGGWGAYAQIVSKEDQKIYDSKFENLFSNSEKMATVIESKVICKQTDRYIGWPTITKTKSGELIAVFSGNRDEHVCPYGITQLIRSQDNGKTWSDPETINNTPLDDRDAGILETKSGTLVVSWFTSMAFDNERSYNLHPEYKRHREKLDDKTVDYWLGNWIRRSKDNGQTWEEPIKQLGTAPHGPVELNDGRLLYVGIAMINGEKTLSVEHSKDEGLTWQLLSTIAIPKEESMAPYSEPHVIETSEGKLVAMFRYQPKDRSQSFLRQTESTDGGKTWSETKKTNIWGYPPHLLKLSNDWILMSYGVRRMPYGERAVLSKDGGKTWDANNEILLSMSETDDLGYPASVQLEDGSIITIYYQIDKAGEKTSLMQTHWKLNNMN